MKLKIEDILLWIIIALLILLAIWKLIGSPTDTASLIAIALFVAGSEILLWKSIFSTDKKISIGFIKIRNDIKSLNDKIGNIESLIRRNK